MVQGLYRHWPGGCSDLSVQAAVSPSGTLVASGPSALGEGAWAVAQAPLKPVPCEGGAWPSSQTPCVPLGAWDKEGLQDRPCGGCRPSEPDSDLLSVPSLMELESQVWCLEKEATELREAVEQQKAKNNVSVGPGHLPCGWGRAACRVDRAHLQGPRLHPGPGRLPEPLPAPPEAWLGQSRPPGGGKLLTEEPVTALLSPPPAPQTSLSLKGTGSPRAIRRQCCPACPVGSGGRSGGFACPAETSLAVDHAPLLPGPPREELEGHGGSGLGREELRGEAAVPDSGQGQCGLRASVSQAGQQGLQPRAGQPWAQTGSGVHPGPIPASSYVFSAHPPACFPWRSGEQ